MAVACGAGGPTNDADTTPDLDPATAHFDWQGHRGARGLRPENTLPGFELALDLGVTTLELDLHLSADDQVVVWHDPIIDGAKCEGDGVGRPVREMAASELRELRCELNPDTAAFPEQTPEPGAVSGDDFGVVTLTELFRFVDRYSRSEDKTQEQRMGASAVRFNVETKRRPDEPGTIGDGFDGVVMGPFERILVEAIDDAGLADRVTVQSFDHRSLWAIRAERPDIGVVALTRRSESADLAELAAKGAVAWSPDHRAIGPDAIREAHQLGLDVVPWTVNDTADMVRLIDDGVDGIITDRPDLRPTTIGQGGP